MTFEQAPTRSGVRLGGVALTLAVAAFAATRATRSLRRPRPPGRNVPASQQAVLIVNPRSGGGKAERFGLVRACQERGIEPLVLQPGDNLPGLASAALARGADVLGVAAGDGSQALVAEVVARHGAAMVVVPSGTRNHLAMDLGLDRSDVIGALDAFGAAVERRVDLGEVNGRIFVNNVSLGLYAQIIRSPAYREAKINTTLDALPRLLGPGSRPFDLRFTGPDGERHAHAHVLQVSNNPYGRTPGGLISRPRLDSGRLGVIALELPGDPGALAAVAAGQAGRVPGFVAWEPSTFEVESAAAIDAGIDGEALSLEPPLRFTMRPAALRIRLPPHASGLSPAARDLRAHTTLRSRIAAAGRTAVRSR